MVFDLGRRQTEHSNGIFEFGVQPGLDHLFLSAEPSERFLLAQIFDLTSADNLPIRFSGPAHGGQLLRIANRHPDFINMLAKPYIRRPAAQLHASCHVYKSHPISPVEAAGIERFVIRFNEECCPKPMTGTLHALSDRRRDRGNHLVEYGVWPDRRRVRSVWRSAWCSRADDHARGMIQSRIACAILSQMMVS